jgi:hypothetical protein
VTPRLREASAEAKRMDPAFIVGAMRSGTSILYRSLQAHPAFMPASGPQLVEARTASIIRNCFGPDDAARPIEMVVFPIDETLFETVLQDIAPLARRRWAVRRVIGEGRSARLPFWVAGGEHLVLRRYLVTAHHGRGAARLLEKSADAVGWVRQIKFAFPRARFLYIVRHPIDVYTSYRRRFAKDPERSAWADIGIDEFARRWETETAIALRLDRSMDAFKLVSYEAFVTDTERAVTDALRHVGLPFDAACLLSDDTASANFDVDPHLFGNVVTQTKSWADYIAPSDAATLEHRLAPLMERLGLPRYAAT